MGLPCLSEGQQLFSGPEFYGGVEADRFGNLRWRSGKYPRRVFQSNALL